ncbi:hypothetical protein [Actinomycetospora straminea]|uniref:ANTAR domain-containing protein n=1 Tax=Actinomycetospora straminea TaxID=663607 RepID=A0ABP9ERS6_9PSEU|nr:hypothetical protein [Actinomycetospora straminea]MDD7935474.1 hypothetical protein [Actinomycetospora straminea]
MIRQNPSELQERRDICQAEFLLALASGLGRDASVEALRYRAALEGLSLHAAALGVLSNEPTEHLLIESPPLPEQRPLRRHLYALRPLAEDTATMTTTSDPRPGRHRRR